MSDHARGDPHPEEPGYTYWGQAPEWPQVGWRVSVDSRYAGSAFCDNDGGIWVKL